jgi:hypothetical protein
MIIPKTNDAGRTRAETIVDYFACANFLLLLRPFRCDTMVALLLPWLIEVYQIKVRQIKWENRIQAHIIIFLFCT